MLEEIMKNIYRIRIPLPKSPLKILNCYVIKGGDRDLVIDTGFNHPECREALIKGLSELDIDMDRTDILLTHLHADHTGLAPAIAVPGTRTYISRIEMPWLYAPSRFELWALDNERMIRAGFSRKDVENSNRCAASRSMASDPNFKAYLPIDDGDEFRYGGYTLKAVVTPGHTPAHMCFWMEEQKTMFTGDHVLFDITPNITLWTYMQDPLGDYLNSLRKIDQYDVRLALPGHRETGDFHARIAQLLEHHEKRLEECYHVVLENPDSPVIDIAGKMTWRIRCNSWEEFPFGQKWFAVGECHSHLRQLEMRGLIRANEDEELIRYHVL